jgi:hypothetical protein
VFIVLTGQLNVHQFKKAEVAVVVDNKIQNMKKALIGLTFGAIAGIIDVIPMIVMNLTWDANLSAFSMWVIVGLFISLLELKLNSFVKGILTAYLVLFPSAILIGWKEPQSLIPILIMTTILGGLLGFVINLMIKRKKL